MLEHFRRRRQNREIVDRLWHQVVDRARRPFRFEEGGLPDSVLGRFESLSIEVFLLLRRCRVDPALAPMAQDLVDRFMTDIDHSMREIGIGYMAVPKRIRKLAGRFYARMDAFDRPVVERDAAGLAAALRGTSLSELDGARADAAETLAHHMIDESSWYEAVPSEMILAGRLPCETERP